MLTRGVWSGGRGSAVELSPAGGKERPPGSQTEEVSMKDLLLARAWTAFAAVAVAAGVSYAATSGFAGHARSASGGRLYACVTAQFKTLNLSSAKARCPDGQQKISWRIKGERGPQGGRGPKGSGGAGPAGPKGDTGAQGPKGDTG